MAGSMYPKLDKSMSEEKMRAIIGNEKNERHYLHQYAVEAVRKALEMREHMPDNVKIWFDYIFGDYWRVFFRFTIPGHESESSGGSDSDIDVEN